MLTIVFSLFSLFGLSSCYASFRQGDVFQFSCSSIAVSVCVVSLFVLAFGS